MSSTPYTQAYVATMENGAILLVVVSAFHTRDGKEAAKAQAEAVEQCALWELCAYPVSGEMADGTTLLHRA